MTYIAAFRCLDGIVMCADTQETVDDQKQYCEKLYISENQNYPIAIGGAGTEEPIEALAQEIIARAESQRPETAGDLKNLIKASIDYVYAHDVPISAWQKQYRTAQLIIAAKPLNEDFMICKIHGRRVSNMKDHAIIGYATPVNSALLTRLYRKNLPMQQAVMLAIYLVSQSKELDAHVGGDSQIAIVTPYEACFDYPEYIVTSEARIRQFINLIDNLFLLCVDTGIPPSQFTRVIDAFNKDVTKLRDDYLHQAAAISLDHSFNDPSYHGEPYARIFPGAITEIKGDGTIQVTEESKENVELKENK